MAISPLIISIRPGTSGSRDVLRHGLAESQRDLRPDAIAGRNQDFRLHPPNGLHEFHI
jgi:hypothetical protein